MLFLFNVCTTVFYSDFFFDWLIQWLIDGCIPSRKWKATISELLLYSTLRYGLSFVPKNTHNKFNLIITITKPIWPRIFLIRDNPPKDYIANQSAGKGLKRLTSIQYSDHRTIPIKQLLRHSLILFVNVVFVC